MNILKNNLTLILICLSYFPFAQTGPGGVGTSTSNVLWLSADYLVYNNAGTTLAANTDNVQQWNDRSGNAKNASQSASAARPNYFTNVVNALPAIRFSAGNDHIMATSVSTANVASVWAVAAVGGANGNSGLVVAAPAGTGSNVPPGNKDIGVWVNTSSSNQVWGRGISSSGTQRDISQTTSLTNNTFYVINTIYRSATSINQFVNGAAAGNNNTHDGTLSSWRDITVGRQGTESWNGDIAEVIFYNIEVNSAQKIIVDNYLAAKYGLSLSSADLYDKDNVPNGNFDFELAGIGRVNASNLHASAQGTGIVKILNPTDLGDNEFLLWGHNNASTQATNTTDVPSGVQGRMARVWRVSEVNAASASVDVGAIDIQFDLTGLGAITASDLRLLVDTDNDGDFTNETGISGATLISGTTYQFSGVTAITNNVRFSLGTINKAQTPLPVELVEFTAKPINDILIQLNWRTASEKNNAAFTVQRTDDGSDWKELASLPGALTSSETHHYSFIDQNPNLNAVNYYRLKQVDTDGQSRYSPIVDCELEYGFTDKLGYYPNPSFGELTITGAARVLLTLKAFDALGKQLDLADVITKINPNKLQLNLRDWTPGLYLFKTSLGIEKIELH